MYFKIICASVALLSIISIADANDIRLGYATPRAKKIFSEIKEADPALWKRTDDVIINTPNNDLIEAVYVTDLREDKDGEAYIESGGVGMKSVTIALKSPTILRGYKFEIEVYAVDPSSQYQTKGVYSQDLYSDSQYPRKW
ncbi:hypothetical protein K1T71_012678 [Dendrolimus kikuchii]|uniref:Uncharacterized protein n=1 Tax=Dendrolimus kikuchii TaxID=765133 RepID=A0ACC1CJZ6_9NEOP|nr:hypothetical protein K1T71_012678 [Dendrolimus kikuchii]